MDENVTSEKKSKKGLLITLAIIIVLLAGVGVYYFVYYGSPKRIIMSNIDSLEKYGSKIQNKTAIDFSHDFTMKGTLQYDLQYNGSDTSSDSDYTDTSNLAIETDDSYDTSYNSSSSLYYYLLMLQGLSKTTNQFTLEVDRDNKQLLVDYDSKLDTDLFHGKYLVSNDNQYYYIQDFLDKYVHFGENKMFDDSNKGITAENIQYLYQLIIESVKTNLDDTYYSKSNKKVTIDGNEITVNDNQLTLNAEALKKITKGVIQALKDDTEASNIIKIFYKDFDSYQLDDDTFKDNESIVIHIYVDPITFATKEYEIDTTDKDNKNEKMTWIQKGSNGYGSIYKDDTLENTIETVMNDDTFSVTSYDKDNKKIGTLSVTNTSTDKNIDVSITSDNYTYIGSAKIHMTEDGKITGNVDIQLDSNNTTMLEVKINMDATVTQSASIKEDITDAVENDDLTSDDKEQLYAVIQYIFMELMMESY